MRKKALMLLFIYFVPLFLTGCFDGNEIGSFAYVTVLGIEQGVTDRFRITFQIPKSNQGGGGSSGTGGGGESGEDEGNKQGDKETITVEAPSFFSAVAVVNTSISKELNFMHLEAIVISEKMAENGIIGELVIPYTRYRQIRRTTDIIICKGTAEDFVKALKPYPGELVTQSLEELMKRSADLGLYPSSNLNDAYDGLKSNYHSFLAAYAASNKGEGLPGEGAVYEGKYKIPGDYYAGDVPRTDGLEVEFLGSAVFDGDRMVGKLTGFETQMVMLVRNELENMPFTISDPLMPELTIPIEIKEFDRNEIKVDVKGDKPKIDLKIGLEGDVTIIQSGINYEKPEMKCIVENALEKVLEDGIKRTFAKCKALKTDVFIFGASAVKNFLTIPEWEEYNWLSKFPESDLTVKVDFTARRTGKMLKSMPVISSEGKK